MEISAVLRAARASTKANVIAIVQPHRYTRTRDCFEDFVRVLGLADAVVLTEVYAAGEQPVVAADGRALARGVRVAGKVEPIFIEDVGAMPQAIRDIALDGDVVVVMGAGSISKVAYSFGETA